MTSRIVTVAVPAPLYQVFDYRTGPEPGPAPGVRVRVPFGRRQLVGVVLEGPREAGPQRDYAYKEIAARLDAAPLLSAELMELCRWAAAYYQHPIGEVLATALPAALRQGASTELDRARALRLTTAGAQALPGVPARSHAQRALLEALAAAPRARGDLPDTSAAVLNRALARDWIEWFDVEAAADTTEAGPPLTADQSAALERLRGAGGGTGTAVEGFSVSLLEGITGSGKTELYLRRAAEVLAAGRQVLVLVPEIGLTPQLAARFARRFGSGVTSYHSGMPDGERAQAWLRARAGLAPVVVGTRSATFLPFRELGLIVIDEEHDGSFKQQDGLRYSARDLAIVRARHLGIPVILGSATPSLESLANARAGRYRHVRLERRVHSVAPPTIRLLDVRGRPLDHGLSPPLLEAIGRHLETGGQALLFLNRRGYAPVLLCHDCGWQAPCRQCDSRMTLHRGRGRLVCHHCGTETAVPARCGGCGSRALLPVGQGTERIEHGLRDAFPGRRVERFDSDRIRRRGELERLLEDTRSGAIHILVGTQLLAKGHDFAGLSLVGIVDVDQALYGGDFRALERMGQLVTQVAGRAGRVGQASEVILQTHEPHHPVLRSLLSGGYGALCDSLLAQRRKLHLPPYAHLALLRAEAPQRGAALAFLEQAAAALGSPGAVGVLGPVASPMEKLGGRYRAQLLLQSGSRSALQKLLAAHVPAFDKLPAARKVRWSVDVDPTDLF